MQTVRKQLTIGGKPRDIEVRLPLLQSSTLQRSILAVQVVYHAGKAYANLNNILDTMVCWFVASDFVNLFRQGFNKKGKNTWKSAEDKFLKCETRYFVVPSSCSHSAMHKWLKEDGAAKEGVESPSRVLAKLNGKSYITNRGLRYLSSVMKGCA